MTRKLPKLNYEYNSLEPYIDEKTMIIHHKKHHQTYIDKLNTELKNYKNLQKMPVEKLIISLDKLPKKTRISIKNNSGGHYNHSFFWKLLKKDVKINNKILNIINRDFNNFKNFKLKFTESALSLFGSGWTWLVLNKKNKKLEILNTQNQDNPLIYGKIPLLTLDLWEHAYYLKYKNKRADYVKSFFNIINWNQINKNLCRIKY